MPWNVAITSRASTSSGTPPSMAATVTASAFVSPFRQRVISWAMVRAAGTFPPSAPARSARRRVAHSVTTLSDLWNPLVLSRRQSPAPFWHPADQWTSSHPRSGQPTEGKAEVLEQALEPFRPVRPRHQEVRRELFEDAPTASGHIAPEPAGGDQQPNR